MKSISQVTQQFIRTNPDIRKCLGKGLINYSALARLIAEKHQIENTAAVVAACRRLFEREKKSAKPDNLIIALLERSKLIIRNRMGVLILKKSFSVDRLWHLKNELKQESNFTLIECEEVYTIITEQHIMSELMPSLEEAVLNVEKELAQITLIFDKRLETTPGVVSYVFERLADLDINVREEVSCWTELTVLIDEKDLPKAVSALNFTQ